MERQSRVPENPWTRSLMMAAVVLGMQFGNGLVGPQGAVAWAAKKTAAKVSASGEATPQTPAGQSRPSASQSADSFAGKRDPFKIPTSPRAAKKEDFRGPLPPGKRGLVVGQLRLEGIVREDAANSMMAVVTNQTKRAYFLRVHDQVFNGVVSRITADAIHFEEHRLDSRGRLETREIVLSLGSPGGEGR